MDGCGGFSFWWCEWMDVGGVWKEGEKGRGAGLDGMFFWKGEGMGSWSRDDFWLLVLLLLLLRVGIVRIIILMYSYYQSA